MREEARGESFLPKNSIIMTKNDHRILKTSLHFKKFLKICNGFKNKLKYYCEFVKMCVNFWAGLIQFNWAYMADTMVDCKIGLEGFNFDNDIKETEEGRD